MDNKLGDGDEKLHGDENGYEQSEQTKYDISEIMSNQYYHQAFDDYFNNYCQRIEYKLFRKYDSIIKSFSEYINDKWSNGSGDKQIGKILEKSQRMQLFEQEIDLLLQMPRENDENIKSQINYYKTIIEKYNDARFRVE